jgi:hypothetical protein
MESSWISRASVAFLSAALCAASTTALAQSTSPPYAAASANPAAHRVDQAYYAMRHNTYEYGARLTD